MSQEIPEVKMRGHEDYAEVMTIVEFVREIVRGSFNDYDGLGSWATVDEYDLNSSISPSQILNAIPPQWATHIAWFNK